MQVSIYTYCKDLCFDSQTYMSNNLLVFFLIRISHRSFSKQMHCHVLLRSYSQILFYCSYSYFLSKKKSHPPLSCLSQNLGFSPLDFCSLLPLICCESASSSGIDFTCLKFFSFYPLSSVSPATAFF